MRTPVQVAFELTLLRCVGIRSNCQVKGICSVRLLDCAGS